MDKEQLKRIIDSPDQYDETRQDNLATWFADAWGKRMRWVMTCVFVQYAILLIPAVLTAIWFFRTDQIKSQIACAAIFLFCNIWMGFISVFAWVMGQRPNLTREIRRLELRIVELNETIDGKQ